jgi:ankyrin repeat protein
MSDTISLRFAMVQGNFKGLSTDRLSIASLSRRIPDDEFGRTYLHLAARWGTLNRIPGLNLIDPAMSLPDAQGLSVLETWHRYRNEQTASSKSSAHTELPNSAGQIGNDGVQPSGGEEVIVPPSFVPDSTPLSPVQEKILAAINGNIAVPPELVKEDLLKALPNDQCGTTLIHMAAAKGEIQALPSEFLDTEVMLCRDSNGRTPLHRAASRKTFHLVPPGLLNKTTLSAEDNSGVSVMDLLIRKDLVSIVPQSVVSTLPSFIEAQFLEAIRNDEVIPLEAQHIEFLSGKPRSFDFDGSWYHWLASEGLLGILPENLISEDGGFKLLANI